MKRDLSLASREALVLHPRCGAHCRTRAVLGREPDREAKRQLRLLDFEHERASSSVVAQFLLRSCAIKEERSEEKSFEGALKFKQGWQYYNELCASIRPNSPI